MGIAYSIKHVELNLFRCGEPGRTHLPGKLPAFGGEAAGFMSAAAEAEVAYSAVGCGWNRWLLLAPMIALSAFG